MQWHELLSKRITGYINWHRHRKAFHQAVVLEKVMLELQKHEPDHLAITGDLVNIATREEINDARLWLEENCNPDQTSLVPGNHDAYVPGAFKNSTNAWKPWISGNETPSSNQFPYMKVKDQIAIIGFSTSNATLPLRATGNFTKAQAKQGQKLLTKAKDDGLFRVILIHHPPYHNATHRMKKMYGINSFQKMIAQSGAELVLHGHTHLNTLHKIELPNETVNIVGISSASQAAGDKKPVAGFNLFDIEKQANGWECIHRRYAIQSTATAANLIDENQLF